MYSLAVRRIPMASSPRPDSDRDNRTTRHRACRRYCRQNRHLHTLTKSSQMRVTQSDYMVGFGTGQTHVQLKVPPVYRHPLTMSDYQIRLGNLRAITPQNWQNTWFMALRDRRILSPVPIDQVRTSLWQYSGGYPNQPICACGKKATSRRMSHLVSVVLWSIDPSNRPMGG